MKCDISVTSPVAGQTFSIGEGTHVIGRDMKSDVQLLYEHVSRSHAKLEITSDKCVIYDLESSNGTFVNGRKVSHQELKDNDEVKLGNCVFSIRISVEAKDMAGHFVPRQFSDKTNFNTVKVKRPPGFLQNLLNRDGK